MRIPMVAGNWKMNMTVEGARSLVYSMSAKLREIDGVEKVICPPFTALLAVQALLEGSDIGLGAQNMYWEEKGAFTGEISPAMLKELCRYVIIGHSERRSLFGETDETANRRVRGRGCCRPHAHLLRRRNACRNTKLSAPPRSCSARSSRG